jgi:hypothetical protein
MIFTLVRAEKSRRRFGVETLGGDGECRDHFCILIRHGRIFVLYSLPDDIFHCVLQFLVIKTTYIMAERKLAARNERIQSLEQLLREAQDNLTSQNHKFEQQLQLVRERLEQARVARAANPASGGITGITGLQSILH